MARKRKGKRDGTGPYKGSYQQRKYGTVEICPGEESLQCRTVN